MPNDFFEKPILNSPYERPRWHWELDDEGQPTHRKLESRRPASFITPIPKPKKRQGGVRQAELVLDEGRGSRPKSSSTTPRSSTTCAATWTGGATCPRAAGTSRPRRRGC